MTVDEALGPIMLIAFSVGCLIVLHNSGVLKSIGYAIVSVVEGILCILAILYCTIEDQYQTFKEKALTNAEKRAEDQGSVNDGKSSPISYSSIYNNMLEVLGDMTISEMPDWGKRIITGGFVVLPMFVAYLVADVFLMIELYQNAVSMGASAMSSMLVFILTGVVSAFPYLIVGIWVVIEGDRGTSIYEGYSSDADKDETLCGWVKNAFRDMWIYARTAFVVAPFAILGSIIAVMPGSLWTMLFPDNIKDVGFLGTLCWLVINLVLTVGGFGALCVLIYKSLKLDNRFIREVKDM